MNNTKWNEIHDSFYGNECRSRDSFIVRWRTKDIVNGFLSSWDATWTHFGCEPREWDKIEYLQIQLTEYNREYVIDTLKRVHVPGIIDNDIVTVFGYRQDVDYI